MPSNFGRSLSAAIFLILALGSILILCRHIHGLLTEAAYSLVIEELSHILLDLLVGYP